MFLLFEVNSFFVEVSAPGGASSPELRALLGPARFAASASYHELRILLAKLRDLLESC